MGKRWQDRAISFAPILFLLALWYVLARMAIVDPVFLPGPYQVLQSFLSLLSFSFFHEELLPSLIRIGGAFLISVAIAFPLGIVSGQIRWVAELVQPLCGFTRYLPVAALVPLCILWFGIGDEQKIAVITIGVVFQLILLISADSASVPKELIEAGRTFGLTRAQVLWRIVVPWSMPAIWDDLRIVAGWAWSYLVLAELVAGNRGIGYFIIQSQRYLETDHVFAGIIFVGLLGLLTDILFRVSGTRLFRWQHDE
ncbi:MAG: ABC transporter permease [Candidatus Korobacteraceae bacterium]